VYTFYPTETFDSMVPVAKKNPTAEDWQSAERKLLLAFKKLVVNLDPDIITVSLNGFDVLIYFEHESKILPT
jgi:hypothetical protein